MPMRMRTRRLSAVVTGALTSALQTPARRPQKVDFSAPWYRVLWLGLVGFQIGHVAAYSYECLIYVATLRDEDWVRYIMRMFDLGDGLRGDVRLFMFTTSAGLGLWHLVAVLHALAASCAYRRFVFSVAVGRARRSASITPETPGSWIARGGDLWNSVFSTESPYFALLFDVREFVEISTQIVQVYRLSGFLSSPWYVSASAAVLVLNCWATPLIRRGWSHDERKSRVLKLCADIWLSSFFTIVLPFALYRVYLAAIRQYNLETSWFRPAWIVDTGSLLQSLMTTTWLAAVSSRFAGLAMLLGLELAKSIVRERPHPRDHRRRGRHLGATGTTMVTPASATPRAPNRALSCGSGELPKQPIRRPESRLCQHVHASSNLLFVAVGIALMAVHAHSVLRHGATWAGRRDLPICHLHLQPWLRDQFPCAVVEINCGVADDGEATRITGAASEVDRLLRDVDETIAQAVLFRHCPGLELTASLARLPMLVYLEIVNSTIVTWPAATAGLTRQRHPRLVHVVLVDVGNLVVLPEAMQVDDFPAQRVVISGSDLSDLPEQLGSAWTTTLEQLFIERSRLRAVPRVLLSPTDDPTGQDPTTRVSRQLKARVLSLAGNALTELPLGLLADQAWHLLSLRGNPLTTIPDNVLFFATCLDLVATQIAAVPAGWRADPRRLDEMWATTTSEIRPGVDGRDSPLCDASAGDTGTTLLQCEPGGPAMTPLKTTSRVDRGLFT